MTYAAGTEINGYRVTEKLTTSSAGWIGFAEKEGKSYHIKILAKPSYPHPEMRGSEASKEKRRSLFEAAFEDWQRKARSMQHIDREGPIVPVTEVFRARSPGGPADLIVLISPRVPLADVAHAELSPEEKLTFMMAASFALATLHDLGLVHSDIKAKNVPVHKTALGRHTAKLLDFDGSYFRDAPPEETTHDQQYVAPEVLCFENKACGSDVLGPHVDVFSLGVLFAEMWGGPWGEATGDGRYPCEVLSEGRFDVAAWLAKIPTIPVAVPSLIAGMVARIFTDRFTARQVHQTLIGLRRGARPSPVTDEFRIGPGFAPKGSDSGSVPTSTSVRRPLVMKKPSGGTL